MKKYIIEKIGLFMSILLTPYAWKKVHEAVNNLNYHNDGNIDFKRKDAYLLLTNHSFAPDSFAIAVKFRKLPSGLVSRSLLLTLESKYRLLFLARVIPTIQGARDLGSLKKAIRTVKKGRGLAIMPEGELTYYGNTLPIDKSIASLAKKLKVDVITAVAYGGYISKPRWAEHFRDNQYAEIHYETLIPKEDLNKYSIDEIHQMIVSKLEVHPFEWQREHMIKVGGIKRAEGLAGLLYKCPECGAYNSIITSGNDIICTSCDSIGTIDEYGFIQGLKYDNTQDWNDFQEKYIDDLKKTKFKATGTLSDVDYKILKANKIGDVTLEYNNGQIKVTGATELLFDVRDIENMRLTQRNVITFYHFNVNYYIVMNGKEAAFYKVST